MTRPLASSPQVDEDCSAAFMRIFSEKIARVPVPPSAAAAARELRAGGP